MTTPSSDVLVRAITTFENRTGWRRIFGKVRYEYKRVRPNDLCPCSCLGAWCRDDSEECLCEWEVCLVGRPHLPMEGTS